MGTDTEFWTSPSRAYHGENGADHMIPHLEFMAFIYGLSDHPYTHLIILADFVTDELVDACTERGVMITPVHRTNISDDHVLHENFLLMRSELFGRMRFTMLAEEEYKNKLRDIARANAAKGKG